MQGQVWRREVSCRTVFRRMPIRRVLIPLSGLLWIPAFDSRTLYVEYLADALYSKQLTALLRKTPPSPSLSFESCCPSPKSVTLLTRRFLCKIINILNTFDANTYKHVACVYLNKHHKYLQGNEGIAPLILYLGVRRT